MNYSKTFIVPPGTKVNLGRIDPDFSEKGVSRKSAERMIEKDRQRLAALQFLLYAENKRSVLIVLQALDAGGKDGTVNHVISGMNPQGCTVTGFKQPSAAEREHDFLWRIHPHVPEKGHIAVFNRSHYEDVLVARVHDLVPKETWSKRYRTINEFERLLANNGTHVLKFFLHISKEEQLDRFKNRLDDKSKNWKISESDYTERDYWDDYRAAFEDALSKCSTTHAPWFVIPANRKWFRNLAVARIICDTLEGIGMELPSPTVDLADIRRKYHREVAEEAASSGD
ncbi:MAG: polyphosphate kinase 2 family protein [Alphaproteobacteria bacterium]|nr:polyphosphate kinase 2 family protein [Alphaproteobacteria bacterium]